MIFNLFVFLDADSLFVLFSLYVHILRMYLVCQKIPVEYYAYFLKQL